MNLFILLNCLVCLSNYYAWAKAVTSWIWSWVKSHLVVRNFFFNTFLLMLLGNNVKV